MSEISSPPPGAIFPEEEIIPGSKKCNRCTHYEEEHLAGKPCKHLMFEFPMDADQKAMAQAGGNVIKARQLCNCKEFEE